MLLELPPRGADEPQKEGDPPGVWRK